MWPRPRAPISRTRKRVPAVARSTVSGTPISLLLLPAVATVGPAAARTCGQVVLGAGLALGAGERQDGRASACRGRGGPAARARPPGRRRARRARRSPARRARPRPRRRAAVAAKSCPSTRSPGTATKRPPGTTARLSTNAGAGDPHGRGRRRRRPPTAAAISARVISIIGWPAPRAPRRRRRRGAPRRRPPGRSRGPCRRPARCRRAAPRRIASRIAARRSPTSSTSAARAPVPASTAARIAAGSSVRGLSSVTTSTSASRAAISPMIGRLPGSRSPPAPITTISRPPVSGRRVRERRLDGVRLVGVVDDDHEVLAGVDPLEPAGHPAPRGDRRRRPARRRSRPRRRRRRRRGRWRR